MDPREIPGQLQAFEPPLRAVSTTATYVEGQGWQVQAWKRREGGTFATAGHYERLTRAELDDVLLMVLNELLELGDPGYR